MEVEASFVSPEQKEMDFMTIEAQVGGYIADWMREKSMSYPYPLMREFAFYKSFEKQYIQDYLTIDIAQVYNSNASLEEKIEAIQETTITYLQKRVKNKLMDIEFNNSSATKRNQVLPEMYCVLIDPYPNKDMENNKLTIHFDIVKYEIKQD